MIAETNEKEAIGCTTAQMFKLYNLCIGKGWGVLYSTGENFSSTKESSSYSEIKDLSLKTSSAL